MQQRGNATNRWAIERLEDFQKGPKMVPLAIPPREVEDDPKDEKLKTPERVRRLLCARNGTCGFCEVNGQRRCLLVDCQGTDLGSLRNRPEVANGPHHWNRLVGEINHPTRTSYGGRGSGIGSPEDERTAGI